MSRLSNERYYKRHQLLRWVWLNQQSAYSQLPPNQQWLVHDYYRPDNELSFEQLIEHRRRIAKERPSLPSAASKAANRLYRPMKVSANVTTPRQAEARYIRVRAVVRPEIDAEKLARALVDLAMDQSAEESSRDV